MRILVRSLFVLAAVVLYVVLGGPHKAAKAQYFPGTGTGPTPTPNPIKHVVVIIQENRTWNDLFNGYPGSTSSTTYQPSGGGTPAPLATVFIGGSSGFPGEGGDPSHAHAHASQANGCGGTNGLGRTAILACAGYVGECDATLGTGTCAMDGFDQQLPAASNPNPTLTYVGAPTTYLHQYWNICNAYTCGDQTFQSNQGPSQPAHLYLIGGGSICRYIDGTLCATIFASPPEFFTAENSTPAGCENPGGQSRLIDMGSNAPGRENLAGGVGVLNNGAFIHGAMNGCVEMKTIFDLLETAGKTWTWYTSGVPSNFSSDAQAYWQPIHEIQHLCGCGGSGQAPCPQSPPHCTSTEINKVTTTLGQILTDITNGTLSTVSFVSPPSALSDHPVSMPVCDATAYAANGNSCPSVAYVAQIVNAIGQSTKYWTTEPTTVLITWDDWGGIYDPVAPPTPSWNGTDPLSYGFRVPLLMVSPYLKTAGAVDHTVRNFDSILAYIETTFNLGNLQAANAAACVASSLNYCEPTLDTKTDDLTACCFNFARTPLTYTVVDNATPEQHAKVLGRIFGLWARSVGIADGGPITRDEYYANGAPDTDYTEVAPDPFWLHRFEDPLLTRPAHARVAVSAREGHAERRKNDGG